MGYDKDKDKAKKIVEVGFGETGGWRRLVALEEAVFGETAPKDTSFSKLDELQRQIDGLRDKIRSLQSIEENYEDAKKTIAELKEQVHSKDDDLKKKDDDLQKMEDNLKQKEEESKNLKESLDNNKKIKEDLDAKVNELKGDKLRLEQQITSLEEEIKEKDDILAEQKRAAESQILSLKEEKETIETKLTKELSDANNIIENLQETINSKNQSLNDTGLKLNETKRLLEDETRKLEIECSKNENLQREKETLIRDCNQAKAELNDTKEAYVKRFGDWDKDTQAYQDLMRHLYQCESLSEMIDTYGMEKELQGEDVSSVIKFVGLLGNQTTFLPILYNFLEEEKQSHPAFLSEEEITFIKALNNYYRAIFRIDFDFLQFPENNSRFDKNCMSDMFNRGKPFRTVEGVYVPAIMRDANTYLKMALVKGN